MLSHWAEGSYSLLGVIWSPRRTFEMSVLVDTTGVEGARGILWVKARALLNPYNVYDGSLQQYHLGKNVNSSEVKKPWFVINNVSFHLYASVLPP